MNKLLTLLQKRNRTLLEMRTGIFLLGVLIQVIGAFFTKDQIRYAGSVWFGILMAIISTIHMYISLDKALNLDEKTATKQIYASYLIRYFAVTAILIVICITNVLEPLLVFLAYMTLKGTAYLQPFTHKFYNWLFHEEDPIPMTEEEAMAEREAAMREAAEQEFSEQKVLVLDATVQETPVPEKKVPEVPVQQDATEVQ